MATEGARAAASARWLAYVTVLPTDDPAARMRVLRTLESLGCAVLRDGVFLLPDTPAARQSLSHLSDHIARINGSAHLLSVNSLDEAQARQFLALFDRTQNYDDLIKTVEGLRAAFGVSDPVSIMRLLSKHKRDYKIVSTLDFFPSQAKERAARTLAEAEQAVRSLMFPDAQKKSGTPDTTGKLYFRRIWATRKPLWADQLASAWLIRRFIDPEATLLWLDKHQDCPENAISYGYAGATFCNSKNKVTFEEILAGFKLDQNAGLARIGALIHALNAGETKVAEAAGVQTLLQGAARRTESEDQLLAETEMTFDLLFEAYFETPGKMG
ncbi:MAG TPA: chromate resistance protein ChrB domain-containing protein [Burkholderiales bacterium]|nr:chromate resistance protein ChrB domain-containing protein [Burkholderiales bacterium]